MKYISYKTLSYPLFIISVICGSAWTVHAVDEVVLLPDPVDEKAGDKSRDDGEIFYLDDFVVAAEKDVGYYSANSLAASRTNQLIKDTPMVIDVLNEQMIEDFGLYGVEDLSTMVAGVDRDDSVEFSNRQLTIRGLTTRFQFFEFFPRQLPTDGYNKGRVEVVRGPSSLVYGQSDPGGKTNSLAKQAEINMRRPTKGQVNVQVGDKDQFRAQFDVNQTVSEQLALRVMGFHTEREFDVDYRSDEKKGLTLETTYNPTSKTSIRLHIEGIEQDLTQSKTFVDSTSGFSTKDTKRSGTGVAPRGVFLAVPEFVDFIPNGLMEDIYSDSADRTGAGTDVQISSRDDLKSFYRTLGLNRSSNGSFSGPDVGREHTGWFNFIDLKHSFTDNIHFKASFLHETLDTDKITNGGNQIAFAKNLGPLDSSPPDLNFPFYKSVAWTKGSSTTRTNALRTTMTASVEHMLGKSTFIGGFDYDLRKDEGLDHRVWGIVNPNNDKLGYVSQKLWVQDTNAELRLRDALSPTNGKGDYEFRPYSWSQSQVESKGYWLAASNEHLEGRLWTMMGLRLDDIEVESETRGRDVDAGQLDTSLVKGELSGQYVNPSVGILFWLTPNIAPFATYSEAVIAPSGSQRQPDGAPTDPEEGSGYDIGFKFDFLDGTLTGTAVYYHLEKENILVSPGQQVLESLFPIGSYPDLYDSNGNQEFKGFSVPGRTVESEGVELSLYYSPLDTGWSFLASYTHNMSENTEFLGLPELVGDKEKGLSRNSFRLSGSYAFKDGPLKGLRLGATALYRTERLFDTVYSFVEGTGNEDYQQDLGLDTDLDGQADEVLGNRYEIWQDDLFQVDAFVSYQRKFGRGKNPIVWSTALRVKNIFGSDALASNRFQESREFVWSNTISF